MYFWRTRALAEDLRAGRVSERQRMWYMFSQIVLFSILMSASSGLGEAPSLLFTAAECAALVTVGAVGVLLCFEANRRGDNVEFLNRFVCLSWPVTIRLLALFVPLLVVALVAVASMGSVVTPIHLTGMRTAQLGSDGSPKIELVALGWGVAFNVVYYWRIHTHLRWVAAVPSP